MLYQSTWIFFLEDFYTEQEVRDKELEVGKNTMQNRKSSGSCQFTTIMQPGISIVDHDSRKSKQPYDRPQFYDFFAVVIKWMW